MSPTAVKIQEDKSPKTKSPDPMSDIHKKLVKKKKEQKPIIKTIWIAGHAITLAMGLVYAGYYMIFRSHESKISFTAYRIALVGVMASYACTILSQFDKKSLPSYLALMGTINFQYLMLSVVWFFNRSSLFKLIPYMIVSVLQLATAFKIKPVLKYSQQLGMFAAYDEIFLFVVLFIDTILMRGTSGYALIIYAGFYWLRVIESENTRHLLYGIAIKFDSVMSKQTNPKVIKSWKALKKFLTTKNDKFEREYLD